MILQDMCYVFCRSFYDSCKGAPKAFVLDKELESRERNTPPRNRIFKPDKSNLQQDNKRKYKVLKCILVSSAVHFTVCMVGLFGFLPLLTWFSDLTNNFFIIQFIVFCATYTISAIVIFICKLINFVIFMDIGDAAFRYINGRSVISRDLSEIVSDALFSTIFQFIFYVQAIGVTYIPIAYVSTFLHVLMMSLLYSLYIFEYKWCNMNLPFHRRLSLIETNWVYYFGFGLPLVILTNLCDSYLANVTIFSFAFPFFLISGSIAEGLKQSQIEIFPLHIFSTSANILTEIFKIVVSTFKPLKSKPIEKS